MNNIFFINENNFFLIFYFYESLFFVIKNKSLFSIKFVSIFGKELLIYLDDLPLF